MGADFGDINNDGYPGYLYDRHAAWRRLPDEDNAGPLKDIQRVPARGPQTGFITSSFKIRCSSTTVIESLPTSPAMPGVSATDWSWGGLMFDADNDGYSDLYVCNGIYHDLINQDFIDFSASEIMQKMIATGKKEA